MQQKSYYIHQKKMKWSLGQSVFFVPVILTCFYFLFIGSVNCQRHCYSCSTQDSNSTCLNIPNNVTEGRVTVPCKYYCTIRRLEYVYIPEREALISLNRSCEKNPDFKNGSVAMDDIYITYLRACRSHLCNFGSGRHTLRFPDEGEEIELMETSGTHLGRDSPAYNFPSQILIILSYYCYFLPLYYG